MEYMTVLVRWCWTPQVHTGFITDEVQKWFVCRWTYPDDQHLTVICVQIARDRIASFTRQMLRIIANLWAHPGCNRMALVSCDVLLDAGNKLTDAHSNRYKILHVAIRPEASFFTHVTDMTGWLKAQRWKLREDLTSGDNETLFKMSCQHEPHSVAVTLPGSEANVMMVRCNEPQRLYDLLKRYDLICSDVWDDTVALSGRAPCTALLDHDMTTVRVNEIPWNDRVVQLPPRHGYIRERAELGSLRHRFRPGPRVAVHGAEAELVPVAMNYRDPTGEVNDLIHADGRFALIAADPQPESSHDEAETPPALTCFSCHATAEGVLDCGHLCCGTCAPRLDQGNGLMCGVCRDPSTEFKMIQIPERFTYSCSACYQRKQWLTNCSHLTCTCYINRCPVCRETINKLRRILLFAAKSS